MVRNTEAHSLPCKQIFEPSLFDNREESSSNSGKRWILRKKREIPKIYVRWVFSKIYKKTSINTKKNWNFNDVGNNKKEQEGKVINQNVLLKIS